MCRTSFLIGAVVLLLVLSLPSVLKWMNSESGMQYDCRISEISPDVPVKVKEMCRHANSKTL